MLSWLTIAIIMGINQKKKEVTLRIVVRIFKRFATWSFYPFVMFKILRNIINVKVIKKVLLQ